MNGTCYRCERELPHDVLKLTIGTKSWTLCSACLAAFTGWLQQPRFDRLRKDFKDLSKPLTFGKDSE